MSADFEQDYQAFYFTFVEFDGVEAHISKTDSDGFSWPHVIRDVVKVLEKQYGYSIAEDITVKGVCLADLDSDPYAYIPPLQRLYEIDEQLALFPEISAGLTD